MPTAAHKPTVGRTKTATLLLAVQKKLVDDQIFPEAAGAERVRLSLRMNPVVMALQADTYCIVFPLTQAALLPTVEGAGRAGTVAVGRLNVYPRARTGRDMADDSQIWLTDADEGIFAVEQAVFNSLHLWTPHDDEGEKPTRDALLIEPMRWMFTGEPHRRYSLPEWGDVVMEFEIRYLRECTQGVF